MNEILYYWNWFPTGIQTIITIFGIILYFLPIIIRTNYITHDKFSTKFILINIFLGLTPIPRIILILDIIQANEWLQWIFVKELQIEQQIKLILKNIIELNKQQQERQRNQNKN